MTQTNDIKMVVTYDRQERQPITAPTRNWRFSASYESFVVQQTFVLRMKFSASKSPTSCSCKTLAASVAKHKQK